VAQAAAAPQPVAQQAAAQQPTAQQVAAQQAAAQQLAAQQLAAQQAQQLAAQQAAHVAHAIAAHMQAQPHAMAPGGAGLVFIIEDPGHHEHPQGAQLTELEEDDTVLVRELDAHASGAPPSGEDDLDELLRGDD